jgi:hypothetical protein
VPHRGSEWIARGERPVWPPLLTQRGGDDRRVVAHARLKLLGDALKHDQHILPCFLRPRPCRQAQERAQPPHVGEPRLGMADRQHGEALEAVVIAQKTVQDGARNGHGDIVVSHGKRVLKTGPRTILRVFNAGTSYGIGNARLYLAYHTENQTDLDIKRDVYEASGSYTFGPADFIAVMYGYLHDRSGDGNNAQQIGMTYEHYLSKRTTLYASTAFINTRNKAAFTLNGTAYAGITVAPGSNTRGAIVGIVHKF